MCDAKCRVTYCHTFYYDDEYRPLISSCKTCSDVENEFNKAKCFRRWAVCTRRADGEAYLKVTTSITRFRYESSISNPWFE